VLIPDPIPTAQSVYDNMPGEPMTLIPGMSTDLYVVEQRSGGTWILPNHDDGGDIGVLTRDEIHTHRLRRYGQPVRMSQTPDGTVYLSNGKRAYRCIPVELMALFQEGHCPGCGTPYATNGDGPCPGRPHLRTFDFHVPATLTVRIAADSPADAEALLADMVGEDFYLSFADHRARKIDVATVEEGDASHLVAINGTDLDEGWCADPTCRAALTDTDLTAGHDHCAACRTAAATE